MLQLSVNNHFTLPDEVGGYDGIFTMAGAVHTLKAEKNGGVSFLQLFDLAKHRIALGKINLCHITIIICIRQTVT